MLVMIPGDIFVHNRAIEFLRLLISENQNLRKMRRDFGLDFLIRAYC